jgi:putative ABC transport system substrate-binding protein
VWDKFKTHLPGGKKRVKPVEMTCEEYASLEKDVQPEVAYWLDGYDRKTGTEVEEAGEVDLERDVAVLVEMCRPTPKASFWKRMRELGYIQGQNLVIEARWAEGRAERLPTLMKEVLARNVDVLVTYSTPGAIAAKNATRTTPIVGVAMGEPLRTGLAANLARPEGNLTGFSTGLGQGIAGKRLELLQQAVPGLDTVTIIGDTTNPIARETVTELRRVAPSLGLKLHLIEVREMRAVESAFAEAKRKGQAAIMLTNTMLSANIRSVTATAAKHRIPTMYYVRDFVEAGGLD